MSFIISSSIKGRKNKVVDYLDNLETKKREDLGVIVQLFQRSFQWYQAQLDSMLLIFFVTYLSTVHLLLKFLPDTKNDWTPWSYLDTQNVLKVTKQDFNSVLRVLVFDLDMLKRLPTSTGKSEPTSLFPYWEDSLRSLDHTTRTIVRMGVFGSTVAEHLARVLARDDRASSPGVCEVKSFSQHIYTQVFNDHCDGCSTSVGHAY